MYTKFENNPSCGFWVIALTPLRAAGGGWRAAGGGRRAAGGGRLWRKTITSPYPSDTGDTIIYTDMFLQGNCIWKYVLWYAGHILRPQYNERNPWLFPSDVVIITDGSLKIKQVEIQTEAWLYCWVIYVQHGIYTTCQVSQPEYENDINTKRIQRIGYKEN